VLPRASSHGLGERTIVSAFDHPPRTAAVRALFGLLLLQAVAGLSGGIMLIADPRGEFSKLRVEDLAGSPFDTFRFPGVILLAVLGLFPLAAAVGVRYGRRWAWWSAGMVGVGLVIWIVVEAQYIAFSWLQPAMALLGALIIVACLPHSVRRYCGVSR
jgi:hypothetical protein